MKAAIVGLTLAGKTTLLRILTGREHSPAVVLFEDEDLHRLAEKVRARKITGYPVELTDFDGFGKQFREQRTGEILNRLVGYDVLFHVVSAYLGNGMGHYEELLTRMILADLERVERNMARVEKEVRAGHAPHARLEAFQKARVALEGGRPLSALSWSAPERKELGGYGFVTLLPQVVIWNRSEDDATSPPALPHPVVDTVLLLEEELRGMEGEEAEELRQAYGLEPIQPRLFRALRQATRRIRFFTGNEKEARLWLIPEGGTAVDAAAAIHTDLARTFVRADLIPLARFLDARDEEERRKYTRRVGREAPLEDGMYVIIHASR
jgi:ribosome-binding ATPase YchF (GTP1/OBG family)